MKFQEAYHALPNSLQKLMQKIVLVAKPKQILLFGSRARGNHRENSDFDLAIKGKEIDVSDWNRLLTEIQEEPYTLYPIDLVEYENIGDDYKKNIDKEGLIIYG